MLAAKCGAIHLRLKNENVMGKVKSKLTVALGLDVSGNPVVADIAHPGLRVLAHFHPVLKGSRSVHGCSSAPPPPGRGSNCTSAGGATQSGVASRSRCAKKELPHQKNSSPPSFGKIYPLSVIHHSPFTIHQLLPTSPSGPSAPTREQSRIRRKTPRR